jgi:hypothetical protein
MALAARQLRIGITDTKSIYKFCPRLLKRETKGDGCAATNLTLDAGRAAVKIDNRFYQSQSEACASGRTPRGLIRTVHPRQFRIVATNDNRARARVH